jgi:hypothetical protein
MRAFFAEGVKDSFLPFAVEALPTMLHLSLFLFFCGLAVFLWNVNLTVFKLALSWVGCWTAVYGCLTLMPIFRRDSPYYTPLTPLAGRVVLVTLHVIRALRRGLYQLLGCCFCCCPGGLTICFPAFDRMRGDDPRDRLQDVLDMASASMTPEKLKETMDTPSPNDPGIFMWTFDCLDEDHELERFFSGIPDFRHSEIVDDPLPILTADEKKKLFDKLIKFLELTFSSDLLTDQVKNRRAIMCAKAIDLAGDFARDDFSCTLFHAAYLEQQANISGPIAANSEDENAIFLRAIRAALVARPQHRDDAWFWRHAPKALGYPEGVLRDYAAKGNSLSLAILIYATRQQFTNFKFSSWPSEQFWAVLYGLSKFDALNTAPELRDEFCTLWNEIVLKARNEDQKMAFQILRNIRDVYLTLHQNTPTHFTSIMGDWDNALKDPFSYPECDPTSHNDGSVPTPLATVVLATASPDAPSSSVPAPSPVDESLTTMPLLNSARPTLRTTQASHIPVTSPVPAPARKDVVVPLGIPTPLHTPETSISATPRFFASSPATVSLQNNTHLLTPSDPPSLGPSPVLDNIVPTGPLHSQLNL